MISKYILRLTDTIISIITFLIALRIILKLLAARTTAPFVTWVYETTSPLLSPFEGMFPSSTIPGGFTLEISALFALLVYSFLGFLIQSAILRLIPHTHPHVEEIEEETVIHKKRR